MSENQQHGGLSPSDFVAGFAERMQAETAKDSAVGKLRARDKALEKLGADLKVLGWVRQVRKMEPADAEAFIAKFFRYCRWLNMPIGDQPSLFAAADDFGVPATKARDGLAEAEAYEEGYKAGKGGRNRSEHRFEMGSPMHERFDAGWCDGQAVLAEQLGEELPADGSALSRRTKKGAEVRAAKPKGGGRRGRGGRAAAALAGGRDHLGTSADAD